MNPEIDELVYLDRIKKQLEYQNLKFNRNQIQQRQQKQKKQKLRQIQQSSKLNEKAIQALQNQQYQSTKKKVYVQNILQKSYNQQMQIQQRVKTQQKSVDKFYSEMYKKMLQNNEIRRVRDISKMYRVGQVIRTRDRYYLRNDKVSNNDRIKTDMDNVRDSLDQFANMNSRHSIDQIGNKQDKNIRIENQVIKVEINNNKKNNKQQQTNNNIRIENNSKPTLKHHDNHFRNKYSHTNLQYADYLKKQIDRKNTQKQQKRHQQLQKDKLRLQQQLDRHYSFMSQKLYEKERKKIELSMMLERQIQWKKGREDKINGNYHIRYMNC